MKTILATIAMLLACVVTVFLPASANAANCWCSVQCTIPGDGVYDSGNISVASGINFPFTTAKQNQCDSDCTSYVNNNLDIGPIAAMAKQHNYCGPVSCGSMHHLDALHDRSGVARTVDVKCPEGPSGQETGPSQYAVKFMCGTNPVDTPVERGTYSTVVNVHNPHDDGVPFRWKAAFAIGQTDGPITSFTYSQIGADAAQRFDCSLLPAAVFADGFFVIQSNKPLDVTAYYTGGQPQVTALDVDRVARRAVPGPDFACQPNFAIHLDKPKYWEPDSNGSVVQQVNPVPGAWDSTNNRKWLSYASNGASGGGSYYTYKLNFCSCAQTGGRISSGATARTDNGAWGIMTTTGSMSPANQTIFSTDGLPSTNPTGDGNFNSTHGLPAPLGGAFTGTGDGSITVKVYDDGGLTGMSLAGDLVLDSGYAGQCYKP